MTQKKFSRCIWAGVVALLFISATLAIHIDTARAIADSELGLGYGVFTGLVASDPRAVAAAIIRVTLGVLGTVALVIILIGGFTWMTAGGNEEKVGEAKKWIMSGVIGLAIILSAYAITSFVVSQLVSATTEAGAVNLVQ